jgi:uncharacterized protein (DUF362 family)
MIFKEKADDIVKAALSVTMKLLREAVPLKPVVIKPNIVEPLPPPVTTDARVVEGVIAALRGSGIKDIIIAEGSGTGDTIENFNKLGFQNLCVQLVDLDREDTVTLDTGKYRVWKEIIVPQILLDSFIISVPALKEHSMCGVTVSLKNMVGILPAEHYSGYWTYKKSMIHKENPDGCIADIIRVVKPDLAIVDATTGMKGSHISGIPINPPVNLVYGSADPLEADIYGCELLGRDWKDIAYLRMIAEDIKI